MKEHCEEFIPLISRYIDDELLPQERDKLLGHLRYCSECQKALEAFQTQVDLLNLEIEDLKVPSCPQIQGRSGVTYLPIWLKGIACILLMVSVWVSGYYVGSEKVIGKIPSYARVVAPAVWIGQHDPASISDREKLNPVARIITQHQYRLGLALNKEEIDWKEVRDLVESINSLRTDLELLSLHLLDMEKKGNTESLPSTWREITGIQQMNESL